MKTNFRQQFIGLYTVKVTGAYAVLCLAVLAQGCGRGTPSPQKAGGGGEKMVIKGSNTIGEELGPRLIDEYKKDHPNAVVELETKGSASGFWGLIAGVCDIAASSRAPIKDELQQAQVRGIELQENLIGSYGVAIVVHPNNTVANLTRDQVRDIFAGKVQNWKDVGGPDAPIHLYGRDPISGTYLGFREVAMQDDAYAPTLKVFTNYSGIVGAVSQDPNGIGYASIDLAGDKKVKPVAIEGVSPTPEAVNEKKYPYSRPLYFYTRKSGESPTARTFVEFVQSKRGQEVVAQTGNVPRP